MRGNMDKNVDLLIDSISAAMGEISDSVLNAASKALPALTFGGILPAGVAVGITIVSSVAKKKLSGNKDSLEYLVDRCISACKVNEKDKEWCKIQVVDFFANHPIDAKQLLYNSDYKKEYAMELGEQFHGREREITIRVVLYVFESLAVSVQQTPSYQKFLLEKILDIDSRVSSVEKEVKKILDISFLKNDANKDVSLEIVVSNQTDHQICINDCLLESIAKSDGAGYSYFSRTLEYQVEVPYFWGTNTESVDFNGKLYESIKKGLYKECHGKYQYDFCSGSRTWSVDINLPLSFTIEPKIIMRVRIAFSKPVLKLIYEHKEGDFIACCSFGISLDQTSVTLIDTEDKSTKYTKDNIAGDLIDFLTND